MSQLDTAPPSASVDPDTAAADSFWARRLGAHALRYAIPRDAATLSQSLGALTFFSFTLLVLSGLWMAQFYNPNPAAAYDSVLYIITRAPLGDFARSLHFWAASAMVVSIVGHIGVVFYRRAYRAPREVTWYAGIGLAALVFLLVATGTILRYDQEGFEALAHFRAGADLAGPLGYFFSDAFTLASPLLARIFSLHTSLLPLAMAALIGLHFWLVKTIGISGSGPATVPFTAHVRRVGAVALIGFAALIGLAVLAPTGLGHEPVAGYEITKPFWPLLWVYALESLTGMWALIWAPVLVFLFLALVPLLDRRGEGEGAAPLTLRAAGAVLLATLLALGLWAALTPPQQHLGM